ncbi:MAG: protein kinase [Polyangiaceae bacterium]|nr:protein kinase [Polyangiaceae bacterium]
MPPSPAKPSLVPGALVAGKYRLQNLLGRGAAGVVWSAVNVATSRKVALKLLIKPEPRQCERLLREARAAGALHHPNVIDIYDVTSLPDGSPVLVLELLQGQTLQEVIDARAPLATQEAASIGRDVARALSVAHASGIVHRDLKPANIFLHGASDEPPIVKVVDFGISKNLLTTDRSLTETGMAVGSPAFMSPEQVRGERDLDGRTDLWALGVMLYEMVSGRRLFDGRTHEVLTQVLVEPIKPLQTVAPTVDAAYCELVHALLERDAKKRIGSAEVVAEKLGALASPADVKATLPPPSSSNATSTIVTPSTAQGPTDTVVMVKAMSQPQQKPVPKAYTDDDDNEPTHVAPMALRSALAQKTVPKAYTDDEEEEGEATRVAPDAVLRAAITASKTADEPDQNRIDTVRPPAPIEPPASHRVGVAKEDETPVATPRQAAVVSASPSSRPPTSGGPQSGRSAPKSTRPAPQSTRPAPQSTRPAPQSSRPTVPGPAAQSNVAGGVEAGINQPGKADASGSTSGAEHVASEPAALAADDTKQRVSTPAEERLSQTEVKGDPRSKVLMAASALIALSVVALIVWQVLFAGK